MKEKRISQVHSFSPYAGKKGWIRIVEAFAAILVITGLMLIILGNKSESENNDADEIYSVQQGILRTIQLDSSLRNDIFGIPLSQLPKEGDNVPASVREKITDKTPLTMECTAKICASDAECEISSSEILPDDKNIYIQKVMIATDLIAYSPRQLRLFCWEK
ncbi:MAG: hypothetical protein ABIH49_00140 [archaeon]